jgi:GAF domain-containing protein
VTTVETLQRELAAALAEREEARVQKAALAEVLRAINASAGDFTAVFDLILARAMALCDAPFGSLLAYDGQRLTMLAEHGSPAAMVEYWSTPQPVGPESATARVLREGKTSQIADLSRTDNYLKLRLPITVASVELGGIRTLVQVPLVGEHGTIGVFILYRQEVRPFTDAQLALVESFAAQATLAMENARRFAEQREALEQQAATAEVLQVINASPGNLGPVFEAILQKTMHLCEAAFGLCSRVEGDVFEFVADHGVPAELVESTRKLQSPPPNSGLGRLIAGESVVQLVDLANTDVYRAGFVGAKALVEIGGAKTAIFVALRKDGLLKGAIVMYRLEVRAFSDKQVALLQNFAAQAVIAMENARLLTEQREALEQQTATAEILRVIAQSPTDVAPVLEAVAKATLRFCGAEDVAIDLREGEVWRCVAHAGILKSPVGMTNPIGRKDLPGRTMIDRRVTEIPDVAATTDDETAFDREVARQVGFRAALSAPLLGKNEALGALIVHRTTPGAFSQRQIALLESFAAQAVVALENVRLFTELQESLDQQTATAEILRVISQSPTDVTPVLEAVAKAARRFCNAEDVVISLRQGDHWLIASHEGPMPASTGTLHPLNRQTSPAWAILDARTIHLPDITALDPVQFAAAHDFSRRQNFKAAVAAPMLREGHAVGAVALRRTEPGAFTPRQIELLESFAAQAVIALENTRLFTELRESLEYQTATSELLEVISRSASDIQPVFDTMLASAARLCGVAKGDVAILQGDVYRHVAFVGCDPDELAWLRSRETVPGRGTSTARALLEKRTDHVLDQSRDPERVAPKEATRERTTLAVPLLRNGEPLGVISLLRDHVEPFSDRQITLIETFAGQAVIAMENARLLGELRESLDQQTATAEILQVINTSPGDLMPVFRAILEKAHSSCGADMGSLFSWDGTHICAAVTMGYDPEIDGILRTPRLPPSWVTDLVSGKQRFFHRTFDRDRTNEEAAPFGPRFAAGSGIRTNLIIPLRKDDAVLGFISANRREVRPYSDKEISLLENFAAQAVIAMENARLLNEVRQRETELAVTFEHMGDGVAMFDAGLKLAAWNKHFQELLDIPDSFLAARPGLEDYVRLLVQRGELGHDNPDEEIARYRDRANAAWSAERTRPDGRIIEARNNPVPGGGAVLIYSDITERKKAEAEIAAARDAAEAALERQTATADILKVIASSPTDVQPVLDVLVKAAVRFCGATDANIHMRDGDHAVLAAHEGPLAIGANIRALLNRETGFGAAILGATTIHRPDIAALDPVEFAAAHRLSRELGFRAVLVVPMLREGTAIGAISLRRVDPGVYTPQQIELLETFAAQAVIAVENVRLFTELRKALERQTATADILNVIASSPTDVAPVLRAVVKAAIHFCGAEDATVILRDGNQMHFADHEGPLPASTGQRRALDRTRIAARAIKDGETIHIPDIRQADRAEFAPTIDLNEGYGIRALLGAPMMREGVGVGCLLLRRAAAGPFTADQIRLLETFAAQAVIAIENVRLFTELRDSLERLKAAQANLVQSEKMASLGQLTAGIAHEIKNPLNFVNNFATLSVDLLAELKDVAGPALATLDADKRAELDETMELLTGNLGKIAEHGKRADGIVKSMLSHSRGGAGDWAPSDINALVEEALNLAYHGARSQDKEFNVTLERDLGKSGAPIEVVPQDVTRVFLNLFGNGFYAANKRRLGAKQSGFKPTLKVSTRDLGDRVEVKVRDNGIGMPPEVKEKLFQPFFTTKPTGEGTGLGLSISYDIVTQQHGGTIEVESEPDNYTEFTIRLPRARRAAEAARGA